MRDIVDLLNTELLERAGRIFRNAGRCEAATSALFAEQRFVVGCSLLSSLSLQKVQFSCTTQFRTLSSEVKCRPTLSIETVRFSCRLFQSSVSLCTFSISSPAALALLIVCVVTPFDCLSMTHPLCIAWKFAHVVCCFAS